MLNYRQTTVTYSVYTVCNETVRLAHSRNTSCIY